VLRQCEGVDVLSGVYQFYDDRGNALRPVFDAPVKERRLFWFIRTVDSGRYHLERGADPQSDPLWVSIHEAGAIEPNPHFPTLEHLKAFLRNRGAAVDPPEPTDARK
jgi:hypothetical protein